MAEYLVVGHPLALGDRFPCKKNRRENPTGQMRKTQKNNINQLVILILPC